MDFELSDEQRLLRDTMRSFVDEQIRPVAREWEESGRYPEEIVATMRDMGLFGLLVPEEYGGMAADMVSLARPMLTFGEARVTREAWLEFARGASARSLLMSE